jgi:hypothetical protein
MKKGKPLKRSPLKRTSAPLARTAMSRYTPKTAARLSKIAKWRLAVKAKFGVLCVMPNLRDNTTCAKLAVHVHHVMPIGSAPQLKHVVLNGAPLCESCHGDSHRNVTLCRFKLIGLLTPEQREELYRLAFPNGTMHE